MSFTSRKSIALPAVCMLAGLAASTSWADAPNKDARRDAKKELMNKQPGNQDFRARLQQGQKAGFAGRPQGDGLLGRKFQLAMSLDLSAEQRAKLEQLKTSLHSEASSLREQIKARRDSGAAGSGNPDTDRAAMKELQPRMQELHKKMSDGLDAILTAEQKADLQNKMSQTVQGAPFGKDQGFKAKPAAIQYEKSASAPQPTPLPAAPPAPPASNTRNTATTDTAFVNPFAD